MTQILKHPPAPGTDEWRGMMSSSKIAAVLEVSRFQSPFSLWHEMAGNIDPAPFDPDIGLWGHIAERSLAEWWQHNNPGWSLNPIKNGTGEFTYIRHDLGFPAIATIDRRGFNRSNKGTDRFHIIECKTARDLNDWGQPGDPNAIPADYLAQVMWQMGISGIHNASIVVLGPFGAPEIHPVPWKPELFDAIVAKAQKWMDSLKSGIEPELDDSLRTYDVVRGLHPDIDEDASIDIPLDEARSILATHIELDVKTKQNRLDKSMLAKKMGNAKTAFVNVPGVEKPVKLAGRQLSSTGVPFVKINKKAQL